MLRNFHNTQGSAGGGGIIVSRKLNNFDSLIFLYAPQFKWGE